MKISKQNRAAPRTSSHPLKSIAGVVALVFAISTSMAQTAEREGESFRERLKARRAAATAQAPTDSNSTSKRNDFGQQKFSFNHNGLTRHYLVHVPRNYRAIQPTAMVLALHGGGGNMEYQADDKRYGLITASERDGYIVVFPNGYTKRENGNFATWNAGGCCGSARDSDVDDVGFLKEVVARVKQQWNIDAQRVYSIGMSNGAMMSYRLACEAPGIIRGIMAVAGTDNTKVCTPRIAVPILHVHARNDDHVLFEGGAGPNARDPDKITHYVSVPATIQKWVSLNHAASTPERELEVPGAYCERYRASPQSRGASAPVKLCVTEQGGHSWPGGTKRRADEPPSQAINANAIMWEFFRSL
jgi:polyhydroxybutyrate depolymerase